MSFSLQSSLWRVSQTFVRSIQTKAAHRPVPSPQGVVAACQTNPGANASDAGDITTPQAFLRAIGRSAENKVSIDSWDAFWHTSGYDLKKAGLAVKDRRYILWCMEKYRQQMAVEDFAHEAQPRKKIRGRGPRMQQGKLIRSRRTR